MDQIDTQTTDVRAQAVNVVEAMIEGRFRRSERAEAAVDDLHQHGLLAGQPSELPVSTIREHAVALVQCRQSWPLAIRIVNGLECAGLLAGRLDHG